MPLLAERDRLSVELRRAMSVEYVSANRITRADVEFTPDNPWFGNVYQFGKWLKDNSRKNWATWNGCIYRTSDLILGHMPPSPARVEDVQ